MRVLFCVNIPSPYRNDFFNELGKMCDLTVCYERRRALDRDQNWMASKASSYKEVFLDLKPIGIDRSGGSALRKYIAKNQFDKLIITNYISPSCIEAIVFCKLNRIPYWIEYDGGFNKKESFIKKIAKTILLKEAYGHMTTSQEHIEYLISLGINREKIHKYPFTSVHRADIANTVPTYKEKNILRKKLGVAEKRMIVSVGRFNYKNGEGKGFDLLFSMAEGLNPDIGIYIIGEEPTERYVKWKSDSLLDSIHFIPFKAKSDLFDYYRAADLMILLTRGDVWGLVVNESMACGLPVITTNKCIAGLEMIKNGINGYIVPVDTYKEAKELALDLFRDDNKRLQLSQNCLNTIVDYTIEEMALKHMHILSES